MISLIKLGYLLYIRYVWFYTLKTTQCILEVGCLMLEVGFKLGFVSHTCILTSNF